MRKVMMSLALLLWCCCSFAQQHSVVRVESDFGIGMGALVEDLGPHTKPHWRNGVIVTAAHVVFDATTIKVEFWDGRGCTDCTITEINIESDIAYVRVAFPDDLPVLKRAGGVVSGDRLKLFGKMRRQEDVAVSIVSNGAIFCDTILLPGDSGGVLTNADGAVVAVISGGWFWLDGDRKATWPAKANLVQRLK